MIWETEEEIFSMGSCFTLFCFPEDKDMEGSVSLLLRYTKVCCAGWALVYLSACLVLGLLSHLTLHLMAVGLLICLVTYFRLPPPNPSRVIQILGPDPAGQVANNQIGPFQYFH
jgi:hypothetical protein